MRTARRPWRRAATELAVAVAAVAGFALAAQVRAPMYPVPMTLQTAAVFGFSLLVGWRRAGAAASLYLLAAWLGAPVLSGGASFAPDGLLASKTAGYVVGFVPAACMLARSRPATWRRALAAAVAAHAVVLAFGWAWLAAHLGTAPAWRHGVAPFLLGALAKSAAVAPLVRFRRAG